VILALPKTPLHHVVAESGGAFEGEIRTDLSRCWGFPMTKVFVVVRRRWWEEDQRANFYAGRVPTRELHYWKSRVPESRRGMIMAYADRPGSNFWANYLRRPGVQQKPEWDKVDASLFARGKDNAIDQTDKSAPELGESQTRRLIYKLVQYLRETGAESLKEGDIEYYGIKDWGREPYGAANHTWLPETRSWIVLKNLSAFALNGSEEGVRNIHVCGEAYSDYHGFIEGSLRSAAHVLHRIDDSHKLDLQYIGTDGTPVNITLETPTSWLCTNPGCPCGRNVSRQLSPHERAQHRSADRQPAMPAA
jgi:hypothetical protein